MNNLKNHFAQAAFTLPLISVLACGQESGQVNITTYGEDFIEVGIPEATGPDSEGLVDGFSLKYSRFLVALSDVRIEDRAEDVALFDETARIFDLTEAGPHPVRSVDIGAQRWEQVGLSLRPVSSAERGNASAEDVQLMVQNGYSSYVEGEASGGGRTYRFTWGFSTATDYRRCTEADGGEGLLVPTGGSVTMEVTVHGDHFVYDDLQNPDAALRFAAIAQADADQNGDVTLSELDAVSLDTLPANLYGTGGDPSVNTLREYLEAQSRTLIHFQGEGDCEQVRR